MEYLNAVNIPEIIRKSLAASQFSTVFVEEFPEQPVKVPTIVWSVYRRVPGKVGSETRKPRLRNTQLSADKADNILYFGQWNTVIYQFDLFHDSNNSVNELMIEFERFLMEATPAMVGAGVDTFIFDEQTTDQSVKVPPNTKHITLRYMCIFTAVTPVSLPRIQDIKLTIREDRTVGTSAMTRGTGYYDYIPSSLVLDSIVGISSSGLLGTDFEYVQGVDYELHEDDQRRQYVAWVDTGNLPTCGSTYYLTHVKIGTLYDLSVLKGL